MPRGATQLVGYAGEHFVIYKLYRQGLLGTLTAQGTKDFDVLVQSPDGTVRATIQVKAALRGQKGWPIGRRAAEVAREGFFDTRFRKPVTVNESGRSLSARSLGFRRSDSGRALGCAESGNRETNPDPSSKRVSRVRSLDNWFSSFVLGAEGCTACHEQGQQGTQCRSDASESLGHFTPPLQWTTSTSGFWGTDDRPIRDTFAYSSWIRSHRGIPEGNFLYCVWTLPAMKRLKTYPDSDARIRISRGRHIRFRPPGEGVPLGGSCTRF